MNGLTALADIVYESCPHEDLVAKTKADIIDNLDLNDIKLHLYSVFCHFKSKVDGMQSSTIQILNEEKFHQISNEDQSAKQVLIDKLSEIQNDKAFTQIKYYVDSQFKTF